MEVNFINHNYILKQKAHFRYKLRSKKGTLSKCGYFQKLDIFKKWIFSKSGFFQKVDIFKNCIFKKRFFPKVHFFQKVDISEKMDIFNVSPSEPILITWV